MLWLAQMVLNWLWSPTFFGAEAPWLAFAIIVPMLACIVSFIAIAKEYDRTSAGLFLPCAAWVTFATILNGSIAMLNS